MESYWHILSQETGVSSDQVPNENEFCELNNRNVWEQSNNGKEWNQWENPTANLKAGKGIKQAKN